MDWIPITAVAISALCMVLLVWIAGQQKKITERQVRLAAFDKRYEVFESLMKYMSEIIRNPLSGVIRIDDVVELQPYAHFLFDKKIESLIKEAYARTNDLQLAIKERDEAKQPNYTEKWEAASTKMDEITKWFEEKLQDGPSLFDEYLNLSRV